MWQTTAEAWRKKGYGMDTSEQILRREWSEKFIKLMQNRIVASHYKYGWLSENYGSGLVSAVESLQMRLDRYRQDGNTEWLVDVANFAMIEFQYPQHPRAHFRATGSDESPGLAGTSVQERAEEE